jgi:hypothetical protein
MIVRLLDFALLSFLAWLIWSQVFRQWRDAAAARRRAAGGGAAAPRATQAAQNPAAMTLVRCTACGVHMPADRMLGSRPGQVFCSPACQARGAASSTTRQ